MSTFLIIVLLIAILITLLAAWRAVGGCVLAVIFIAVWLAGGIWLGEALGFNELGTAVMMLSPLVILLIVVLVLVAQGKMDWDGNWK